MRDKIIMALMVGIVIGIFLMGFPIMKSGGGFGHKLKAATAKVEKVNRRMNMLDKIDDSLIAGIVNLREEIKNLKNHRWYGE